MAELFHETCNIQGIPTICLKMSDFNYNNLSSFRNLAVIVSTHGIGEPPIMASGFYNFLHLHGPHLPGLSYSVLALGDSRYAHFCQTGKDFDLVLSKLGATRMLERAECDVDFESPSRQWMGLFIDKLKRCA